MDSDNNPALKEIVTNIFHAYFKTVKDTASLVGVEAKLAAKNLVNIFLMSILIQYLLMISWLGVCGLFLIYLVSLHFSSFYALSIITALNISIVVMASIILLKMKRTALFTATRRQLLQINGNKEAVNE